MGNGSGVTDLTAQETLTLVRSWEEQPPTHMWAIHIQSMASSRMSIALHKGYEDAIVWATVTVELCENVLRTLGGPSFELGEMERAMRARLLVYRYLGPLPNSSVLSVDRVRRWALPTGPLPTVQGLRASLASSALEKRAEAWQLLTQLRLLQSYFEVTGELPDEQAREALTLLEAHRSIAEIPHG
jgi:hypothetical protein